MLAHASALSGNITFVTNEDTLGHCTW